MTPDQPTDNDRVAVPGRKGAGIYERLIGVLHRWAEQVNSTEPTFKFANDPEPLKEPSIDEQRELNRVLRTYGSKPIGDAYDEFAEAVRSFFYDAMVLREAHEVNRPDIAEPWEKVEASRSTVRAAVAKIERLVSDELAAL